MLSPFRRTLSLVDTRAGLAARAYASQAAEAAAAATAEAGPADSFGALAAAAPDVLPSPAGGDAIGGILAASMTAVDALHAGSGLPWWASIAALAAGARVALLPVSLQGMKASAALLPLLRQAREGAQGRPPSSAAPLDPGESRSHEGGQNQHPPSLREVARRFAELRAASGAPHPAWALASPLLQLPVFITAVSSIRTMSLTAWPGFDRGGTAWFPDLTLPALDLSTWAAPMGTAGVGLPLAVALAMYANIDAAFSPPAERAAAGQPPGRGDPSAWVLGTVRLALEWAVVPMFVVALQLPQGAVCYWAASSACALGQNHLLRVPATRRVLGLPGGARSAAGGTVARQQPAQGPPAGEGGAAELPAGAAAAMVRAAELHAKGKSAEAAAALLELARAHPAHPRVLFALAQVQSGLRDWPAAERNYLEAARLEGDPLQRARAWFGAGVALHQQEEEEAAAEAFAQAAAGAGAGAAGRSAEQLRVRALVSQAAIARELGRWEEAVALLRQAAKLEPKVDELYLKPLLQARDGLV